MNSEPSGLRWTESTSVIKPADPSAAPTLFPPIMCSPSKKSNANPAQPCNRLQVDDGDPASIVGRLLASRVDAAGVARRVLERNRLRPLPEVFLADAQTERLRVEHEDARGAVLREDVVRRLELEARRAGLEILAPIPLQALLGALEECVRRAVRNEQGGLDLVARALDGRIPGRGQRRLDVSVIGVLHRDIAPERIRAGIDGADHARSSRRDEILEPG